MSEKANGTGSRGDSDAQGHFRFLQLPVGSYTLTVTKDGFKSTSQKDLPVHIATMTTTPVKLEVGVATETIVVEAAAISLNTENGEVVGVMLSEQVSQLPLNGRNFIELTTLLQGVAV